MVAKNTQALDILYELCISNPRLKTALRSLLEEEKSVYMEQLIITSDEDYSARCKGAIIAIDTIRKKVFK